MTDPVIMSDGDVKESNDDDSSFFSSEHHRKIIIVSNSLPLNAKRDKISGKWCFSYDEDSIFWQLKDGLSPDADVVYVGSLKSEERRKILLAIADALETSESMIRHENEADVADAERDVAATFG